MGVKEETPNDISLGAMDLDLDSCFDFTDVDIAPSSDINTVSSGLSGNSKFVPIPSFDQMFLNELDEMFARDANIDTPQRAAARLLRRVQYRIVEHNTDPDTHKRKRTEFCWPTVNVLPPIAIAHLVVHFYHVCVLVPTPLLVAPGDEAPSDAEILDEDSGVLAVYVNEAGVYSINPNVLSRIIRQFGNLVSTREREEVRACLAEIAPRRCPERNLIPMKNGIFNPVTKEFSPFTPSVIFDSKLNTNFVKDPPLPVYEPTGQDAFELLKAPWPEDCVQDHYRGLFWQVYRSVLTGSKGKVIHFTGAPRTGKSAQIDIFHTLVGEGASTLLSLSGAAGRFGRSKLVGKRLYYHAEMGGKQHLEAELIKSISTGDVLEIERKFKDSFLYRPYGLWVMAGNSGTMSSFDDKSMGIVDRFIHIPFDKVMSEGRAIAKGDDGNILEFLTSPSVLEWVAFHALVDVPDFSTYDEPASVLRTGGAVNEETMEIPLFLSWLEDDSQSAFAVMSSDFLPRAWLYDAYRTYLETTAPAALPMKLNKFLEALRPYLDSEVWDRAGDARAYVAPDVWRMENYRPIDVDKFPRGQAGARFLGGQQRGFKRLAGEAFPSSSVLKKLKIKIHNPDGSADVEFTTLNTFTYSNIHVVLDNPEAVVEIEYSPVSLSESMLRRIAFPFGFATHKPVERRIKYQDELYTFTSRKPQ